MGQNSSTNIQDFVSNSLAKIVCDDASCSLISDEIVNMTYEEFIFKLGELNQLSKTCLDSMGKQLLFAVKKGSDSTMFWKATVQIACVKVDPMSKKVGTYRLLNLKEFLQVFRTLKCQHSAVQQSTSSDDPKMSVSTFYENITEITKDGRDDSLEAGTECCICLERKPDILLPCAHSYCLQCIEEWNEDHQTCPVCREKLLSTDDSWVLSEVPKAEEISEEIRMTLMHLADEKPSPCKPS